MPAKKRKGIKSSQKKAAKRPARKPRKATRPKAKKRQAAKTVARKKPQKAPRKAAKKRAKPAAKKAPAKLSKRALKPAPKRPLPLPRAEKQPAQPPAVEKPAPTPEHHPRAPGQAPTPPGKKQVLVFLGPPGVGKGTQAAKLAAERMIPHISTGDLFRDHMKRQTPLGVRAQEFINAGRLVPDEITVGLVEDRLRSSDCAKGFVLDGFPRTVGQHESLVNVLAKKRESVTAAIYFSAPRGVIIERISGRRTCKSCGAISHAKFNPTQIEGKCDNCGGPTYQREDDNEQKVEKRLEEYHANTGPLIQLYRDLNLLHEIDATRSVEEIYDALKGFVHRL